MSATPDPVLMAIAEKYSFPAAWDGSVPYDVIRSKSRELRQTLLGKYADQVIVTEYDMGRHFEPKQKAEGQKRVIVYIHGGGWCNCDPYTHGGIMTDLAALSGYVLHGISYPMAPENPYPAALDLLCEKVERISEQEGCEIILAGDSAGANLALAVALRLRDEAKNISISALLLWYGCYRPLFDTRSHKAFGDGSCGLTTDGMKLFWGHYLSGQTAAKYADLTDADMTGLPACYLCEAECDCLADDSRWLAGKLMEAGVPHFYDQYAGATHGFLHFSEMYEASHQTLTHAANFVSFAGK